MRPILPLAAMMLVCLAACVPPGKGPKAERGYQRSTPVIAALERYREARGVYPDSLRMLVPAYLPDSALATPPRAQERYPFEYRREADGYALSFRYVGPGMNECTYGSPARAWKCHGYF